MVGEGEIPRTVPNMFDLTAEGLCCGYDSGVPVTDDYTAPFRFTGTIKRVVVDLDGAPHVDHEARARAALAGQ
jgi:arylsulfatase